jgi:hypothetical protein
MQGFIEGKFNRMEGEEITDKKLARANILLQEERAGKGEDGVFNIDDVEADQEAKKP